MLCLRAQIYILSADIERNQANNKRETLSMSWYGNQSMDAVYEHEEKAMLFEEKANSDVTWAKM